MNNAEVRLRGDGRIIPPTQARSSRFAITLRGVTYPLIPPVPGEGRWCEENFGLSCLWVAETGRPRLANEKKEYRFTSGHLVYQPLSPMDEGRESLGWGGIRVENEMYLIQPRIVRLTEEELRFEPTPGFLPVDQVGGNQQKTYPVVNYGYRRPTVFVIEDRASEFNAPAWVQVDGLNAEMMEKLPVTMVVRPTITDLGPWLYQAPYFQPQERHFAAILQAATAVKALNPSLEYHQMIRPGIDVEPLLRQVVMTGPPLGSFIDAEARSVVPGMSAGILDVPLTREAAAKRIGQRILDSENVREKVLALWPLTLGYSPTEVIEGLWEQEISDETPVVRAWMFAVQVCFRAFAGGRPLPNGIGLFADNAISLGGGRFGTWECPEYESMTDEAGFYVEIGGCRAEIGYLPNIIGWINQGKSLIGAVVSKTERPPPYYPDGVADILMSVRDIGSGSLASAGVPRIAHRETFFEEDDVNQGFCNERPCRSIERHRVDGDIWFPIQFGIRGCAVDIQTDPMGKWIGNRSLDAAFVEGEIKTQDMLIVRDLTGNSQRKPWIHRMWGTAARIGALALREGGRLTQIEVGPCIVRHFRRESRFYSAERLNNRSLARDGLSCGLNRRLEYARMAEGGTINVIELPTRCTPRADRLARLFNAMSLEIALDTEIPFAISGVGTAFGGDMAGAQTVERGYYSTETLLRLRREPGLECVHILAGVQVRYTALSYGIDNFTRDARGGIVLETDLPIVVPVVRGRISQTIRRKIEVALLIKTAVRVGATLPGALVAYFPRFIEGRHQGSRIVHLPGPDDPNWWPGRFTDVPASPRNRESLRKTILEAVQVGQKSRLDRFLGQAVEKILNARSTILCEDAESPGTWEPLAPPDELPLEQREACRRQITQAWRERQPLSGAPPLMAASDTAQRALEVLLGRDRREQIIVCEKPLVAPEDPGEFITFDSARTRIRDTADEFTRVSDTEIIWRVAIAHPNLTEQELEKIRFLPGSLYALGRSLPMLGPCASVFSLDAGERREVTIVSIRVTPEHMEAFHYEKATIEVHTNLTPERVTHLASRGADVQRHMGLLDSVYDLIGLAPRLPIGSYFEDRYSRAWNTAQKEINKYLSREMGIQRAGTYTNPVTVIPPTPEAAVLMREVNETWSDQSFRLGEEMGRFTAPLRRGSDLSNLLQKEIITREGFTRWNYHSWAFRNFSLQGRREVPVCAYGFFLKRELFYDMNRARLLPAPYMHREGVFMEITLGYSDFEDA